MPRKPRIEYYGAMYHVISRGNNRKQIFFKEEDYDEFLQCINITRSRYPFIIYAYQLMPNHIHLLAETKENKLSEIMHSILTRYARYFNKKYKMVGHLFQGRYKAILCQKEDYLLELIRYIHLNCVRAKLTDDPAQWIWSSHRVYLGLEKNPLISEQEVLGLFNKNINSARELYAKFITEGINSKIKDEVYPNDKFPVLGNDEFIEMARKRKFQNHKIEDKLNIGLENLAKAVSENTNMDAEKITGPGCTKDCTFARDIFSYIAHNHCGQNVSSIALFLNRTISAITMSLIRTGNRLGTQDKYKNAVEKVVWRIKL